MTRAVIELITKTDINGNKKTVISRIDGFPTAVEISCEHPDYMNNSHLSMDECLTGNRLAIRSYAVSKDLVVGDQFIEEGSEEFDNLMKLIEILLMKWLLCSNGFKMAEPDKITSVIFTGNGYKTTHPGQKMVGGE